MIAATVVEERIREAIGAVRDPEIPAVTLDELGVVGRVDVLDEAIEIDLLPTFIGCPALDVIRLDVERAAAPFAAERPVRVRFVYDPPWTTDRITERGREALRGFGIGPPLLQIRMPCPYCGSLDTIVESDFGPTLCRTVRYCNGCKNPFEGFKSKEE